MKKVTLFIASVAVLMYFTSCGSAPVTEDSGVEAPVIQEDVETQQNVQAEEESDVTDRDGILAKIEDARKAALEAGADKKAPQLLEALDTIYEKVKAEEDISVSGTDLALKYQGLADYLRAKDEKQKIDDNDFASYDQKSYDEGVKYLALVEEAYENGKTDISVSENSAKAYGKFKNVIFAAYKNLAAKERAFAFEAKRKADSVKAGVAKKDAYKEAAKLFQSGDQLYSIQAPEKAYENYKAAKEKFTALYEEVAEKRAAAQAKLEEAKRAVEDSANFAAQADASAPITEPVEGIEEEDTVLLEEDNYAAAEDAEADIPEIIDGMEVIEIEIVESEEGAEEADTTFEPENADAEEVIVEVDAEDSESDDEVIDAEVEQEE